MKITGVPGRDATIIRFNHQGKDLHFRWQSGDVAPVSPGDPVERPVEAVIDFGDLYEVRDLIQMLEKFQEFCKYAAGTWRPNTK